MTKIKQTKTCNFDELKNHVEKLNQLLKNPELELIDWCVLYNFHMKAIIDNHATIIQEKSFEIAKYFMSN